MNLARDELLGLAWTQLWQVTALVVAVGLLTRLLCRRRPHLACVLWMLVVLKCLTPPLWSSPTSVFSWLQVERASSPSSVEQPATTESTETVVMAIPTVELPGPDIAEPTASASPVNPISPAQTVSTRPSISWPTLLLLSAWLVGLLMLAGAALFKWLQCWRLVRRSIIPTPEPLQSLLAELRQQLGIWQKVRLVVTSEPIGPATFGVLPPVVILPQAVLAGKETDQIKPILAHELIHVRRGDVLLGLLQSAVQLLWWFHPLVWWANRQASRAVERCCDEEVLAGLDCRPAVYARCLVDVLQLKHGLSPLLSCPGIHARGVTSQRLEGIMKRTSGFHRRTPVWCWVVLLVCSAVVLPGAVLPSVPYAIAAEEPAAAPPAPAPVAAAKEREKPIAQRRITFNYRYQRWNAVIEDLAKQMGLESDLRDTPRGTFNYNDTRQYTPAEAINLLNSVLATKGYELHREEKKLVALRTKAGAGEEAAAEPASLSAAPPQVAGEVKGEPSAKRVLRVRVVLPDGRPAAGAKIHSGVWTTEPFKANRDYVCDAQGQTAVELPNSIDTLRLWARMDGYVPLFAHWESQELKAGGRIPAEFTFKLEKGTVIGGFVKNEDGQPIAGAKVEVRLPTSMDEQQKRVFFNTWLAFGDEARTTDAQGRWTLDNVPKGDDVEVTVRLSHPDYINDYRWGVMQHEARVTTAMLRQQTGTIVMARGVRVTGTVTDPNGKPVPGAVVVWGDDPYGMEGSQEVRTDERGVYRFPPLPPMPTSVTVIAEGWAPDLKKITITRANPPVDFQLKPGKTLRLRFVDRSGKPLPEVYVGINSWRGGKALYNHKHPNVLDTKIPRQADKNGLYEWTWAPEDRVEYTFYKGSVLNVVFTADGREHEVKLGP